MVCMWGGILWLLVAVAGCSSNQSHTRTAEELELASQNSQREIERLRTAAKEASEKLAIQKAHIEELEIERDALAENVQQIQSEKDREAEQLEQVKKERETIENELTQVAKIFEQQIGDALHVQQEKDRIILTVLGRALFESGDATLTPVGFEVMKQVGKVLSRFPEKFIQVEGHTDNVDITGRLRNTYPSNWELSTARATTVLRFFIDETGLNPDHFAAVGYAETRPVASNDTDQGRAQNRRVEIVLYPKNIFMPVKKLASPSLNPSN